MTNDIALDQLQTKTLYDVFLKDDPDDEPMYRSVTFSEAGFSNGAPTANFRDPASDQPIRNLSVSQYIARPAAAAS